MLCTEYILNIVKIPQIGTSERMKKFEKHGVSNIFLCQRNNSCRGRAALAGGGWETSWETEVAQRLPVPGGIRSWLRRARTGGAGSCRTGWVTAQKREGASGPWGVVGNETCQKGLDVAVAEVTPVPGVRLHHPAMTGH